MGLFAEKFEPSKLKSHLKMAQTRIELLKNKKRNGIKVQQRQIADLLRQGKDESARIKVENVIRDDFIIEAYEILELFCDLVQSRIQLIAESRTCPNDLKEAISTILYAVPRADIPELMVVREQFTKKYGKEFVLAALENKDYAVNQRFMIKLNVKIPEPYLCVNYLKEIAEANNIDLDEGDFINTDNNRNMMMTMGGAGAVGGNIVGGANDCNYVQPSLQIGNRPLNTQQFYQPSLNQFSNSATAVPLSSSSSSSSSIIPPAPAPPTYSSLNASFPPQPTTTTTTNSSLYEQQLQLPPLEQFTHSGYNIDFTPGHEIVPASLTPRLSGNRADSINDPLGNNNNDGGGITIDGLSNNDDSGNSSDANYDFDALQKRFEMLKRAGQ
jgi:hypothetical protein